MNFCRLWPPYSRLPLFLPSTRQVVSSIDVIFDKHYLNTIVYKTRAYREVLLTRPISDPIAHNTDITDHTGNIITSSFLPLSKYDLIEEEVINIENSISLNSTNIQNKPQATIIRRSDCVRNINKKYEKKMMNGLA